MTPPIGEYSQVMAMTQELINNSFFNSWNDDTRTPTLLPIFGRKGVIWFTDVLFDAPSITIKDNFKTPDVNLPFILNSITIQSGTFWYVPMSGPLVKYDDNGNPIPASTDAAGCVFAFPCTLQEQVWKDGQTFNGTNPEEFKATWGLPSTFNLFRLLMDMNAQNGAAFDPMVSNLHPLVPILSTIDSSELDSAHVMMIGFLLHSAPNELLTLGYRSAPPDNDGATFTVTSSRYETSDWFDANGQIAPAANGFPAGYSVFNYLCWKQTVDGDNDPDSKSIWLQPTTSWTPEDPNNKDDSAAVLGRFIMKGTNFFDKWLLPSMAFLAHDIHIAFTDSNVSCDAGAGWSWSCSYMYGGSSALTPPSGNDPGGYALLPESNGTPNFKWKFTKNYDLNSATNFAATIAISGEWEAQNTMEVTGQPNSNRIQVTGSVFVATYVEVWDGVRHHAISNSSHEQRQISYSFNIDLVAVSDGGMSVVRTLPCSNLAKDAITDVVYTYTNVRQDDASSIGGLQVCEKLDDKRATNSYANVDYWKQRIQAYDNHLGTDSQYLHKLILPAGQRIFYDNPIINENGDFMCDVKTKDPSTANVRAPLVGPLVAGVATSMSPDNQGTVNN